MKWGFSKGAGGLKELGLVGSEGEFYFHASKAVSIRDMPEDHPTIKSQNVPIFPYNNVLAPHAQVRRWFIIFLY